jgi:two-component system OmpR family response regulator
MPTAAAFETDIPRLRARVGLPPVTSSRSSWHNVRRMGSDVATSPAATLLLVEDDQDLRAEMAGYLAANGYAVHQAGDVGAAREALKAHGVQLSVLDVNLPGEDGLSLCRSLHDTGGPPVLMLSALGESIDRILGLELGADDYVVKPITPRELLARVKALLRRRPAETPTANRNTYGFAGFHLDLAARQLKAPNGTILLLTRGELAILQALLDRPQSVVSREELARIVRGEAVDDPGRAIDLHISRLRRKIQDQTDDEIIRTYRGAGYLLDARVSVQ